jgi:polyphosphate kinase
MRKQDVLVHHPYDSFECVVEFVKTAAADPQVLAIKQTLYRVSGNSQIIAALIEAVENGKQVTVLVELMARFDEENNINWAKRLEDSGAHVVYGLSGLKTHCKLCLVVRREDDGIRRYIHMGTGNYNDSTARIYTDLGYFTSKETFGQDISSLFNMLTGYSTSSGFNKISIAPGGLRRMFIRLIDQEEENAADGKYAAITAKMNSLSDTGIIDSLYRASQAGVKIRLIVRGICCLRSGIPGISENITVVSIVDRFLEHSRIFCFENGGNPRVYLSSADWMIRNLDQRVEIAFPLDGDLQKRAIEILELGLADTEKKRVQNPDGTYSRVEANDGERVQSQLVFYERAAGKKG